LLQAQELQWDFLQKSYLIILTNSLTSKILKETVTIYPDLTQGIADVSNYNDGLRGGRVAVRAKIGQMDKTLW
jgi:hypothetical protein